MKCRVCGCSEDDPCTNVYGDTCSWADGEYDLCSTCHEFLEALVSAIKDRGISRRDIEIAIEAEIRDMLNPPVRKKAGAR